MAQTKIELIDKVEETLRLFAQDDPTRNVAIAVVNTVLRELNVTLAPMRGKTTR